MCRELYIVISYAPKYEKIDVKVKYRWVYQLTKHLNNVKILLLDDNTESKISYKEEYWKEDYKR